MQCSSKKPKISPTKLLNRWVGFLYKNIGFLYKNPGLLNPSWRQISDWKPAHPDGAWSAAYTEKQSNRSHRQPTNHSHRKQQQTAEHRDIISHHRSNNLKQRYSATEFTPEQQTQGWTALCFNITRYSHYKRRWRWIRHPTLGSKNPGENLLL